MKGLWFLFAGWDGCKADVVLVDDVAKIWYCLGGFKDDAAQMAWCWIRAVGFTSWVRGKWRLQL